MLLTLALLSAQPEAFPERTPGMIEACLEAAVASGSVSQTEDSHKYICGGEAAARLWQYLEDAKIESWEQDTEDEGRWLSRGFPLGGCFKRVRKADGTAATGGLSCTVWIPRPVRK